MSDSENVDELTTLYRQRFSDRDLRTKDALWGQLVKSVFQQYVPIHGTVLDLGAGNCEFSNAIIAERRIAVDLNPDTRAHAAPSVEVILTSSEDLGPVADESVDTVFSSNFFEHLRSKDALLRTLDESHRVLRSGGKIVVLMPNIRYLAGRYWDYFDHHVPLTHSSLGEALELSGFRVERVVPRFLPYTVKDAPVSIPPVVIALYLRFRPAWRLLGRQMLVVASRP